VKVSVLFFAVTRDLAGAPEATLDLSGEAPTVADLVDVLERTYAELRGRMAAVRIAKNERFARLDERLHEGDVIALVPPVSGG
jgi:molybdopterin synthase sulfur carrier subunit